MPDARCDAASAAEPDSCSPPPPCDTTGSRYRPWAELVKRTFGIDVETCPRCSGRIRLLALVTESPNVRSVRAGIDGYAVTNRLRDAGHDRAALAKRRSRVAARLANYAFGSESGKEKMNGSISLVDLGGADLPALTRQAAANVKRPSNLSALVTDPTAAFGWSVSPATGTFGNPDSLNTTFTAAAVGNYIVTARATKTGCTNDVAAIGATFLRASP
jgi:hypothetical protein